MKLSKSEWKKRMCFRVAQILHDHFQNGSGGGHSRLFEVLISDDLVTIGESSKGKEYREHVVPCCLIRNACLKMFKDGSAVEEVALAIEKHVAIVRITFAEANYLDKELGLKNTMPTDWEFNKDDIFARLRKAGIEFSLYEDSEAA